MTLFSALVKMEDGLEEEKNSLPTDQNKNAVSTNPPRITRRYVMSFPACTTEGGKHGIQGKEKRYSNIIFRGGWGLGGGYST